MPAPAPLDSIQSALSVREDTAELANYLLSDQKDGRSASFLSCARPSSSQFRAESHSPLDEAKPAEASGASKSSETIEEVSEPSSPDTVIEDPLEGPSMLANMLRRSPPDRKYLPPPKADQVHEEHILYDSERDGEDDHEVPENQRSHVESMPPLTKNTSEGPFESTPLLSVTSHQSWHSYGTRNSRSRGNVDLEGQKKGGACRTWISHIADSAREGRAQATSILRAVRDPKGWDRRAIWQNVVVTPVACLPAVIVGLLLNILDALSYGENFSSFPPAALRD